MADASAILSPEDAAQGAFVFRHPLDAAYGCQVTPISRMVGMEHGAINHVVVAPGEQGFPLHRHQAEEEWLYVLSGTGEVLLDNKATAIGPGVFAIFPAAKETHAVRNTGSSDLVCLMGGSAPAADVIDLPELGHRVAKTVDGYAAAPLDAFSVLHTPVPSAEE